MKKIITLIVTLFLLSIFAVTSFAEGQVKIIKHFDADTTEGFYKYRNEIVEAYFCNSVDGSEKTKNSWSVGETPQMGIMAWLELNESESDKAAADRYNLYIGAEGGFYANSNMSYFFKDFKNLKKIDGFENVNTELLTNAEGFFSGCNILADLDLTSWNTAKVVTMSRMFYQCREIKELDLSAFNTESLTSMHYMFASCSKLRTIFVSDSWKLRDDITGLNTFVDCTELSGNINYDRNKVSCAYGTIDGYMTKKKSDDENPDVRPDTKLARTIKAYGLADETDFNAYREEIVSVTFLDSIDYLSLSGSIKNWDVSTQQDGSVKAWIRLTTDGYDLYIAANGGVNANPDSSYMFYGYSNLKKVSNLQNFITTQAEDMKYMFYNCKSLQEIDISSFDMKNTRNISYMFGFCSKLQQASLSVADTSSLKDIRNLFYYCSELRKVDFSGMNFSSVEASPVVFTECPVKEIVADGVVLSDKAAGIFKAFYNGKATVEAISLKGADTSDVTDMSHMFENSAALKSLDLSSFDLSRVNTMAYMFSGCSSLEFVYFGETKALDVTDMSYMFSGCSKLNAADLSNVSTGSIRDMSYMFSDCSSLERLDLSKFKTALLQNLDYTFSNCTSLRKIYVGDDWSIGAVASGVGTFQNCMELTGSVAYVNMLDSTYKAATINGYLTHIDPTVVVPPPPVTDKEEENEDEPQKLNFFERIIQWFKNLFERLFGKRD